MARGERRQNLARLGEIAQVAARHGFGYAFGRKEVPPEALEEGAAGRSRGRRVREMLDELGPTFVKFGQLLSTRPDIVPPDILEELRGLQDDARPEPFEHVRAVVEAELGLTIEQVFAEFDEQPIAAASIGQVHRARLPGGQEVVVKVQRPDAERQISADIQLLYQAAKVARDRIRKLQFIDLVETVDEFARTIRRELDYGIEARNAEVFRRNFAGDETVSVPKIYWRYTTARVLTMERVEGTSLRHLDLDAVVRRRPAEPREPHHPDLDADGLRARLLPRRPASGQHPRARPGPHQRGRLRDDRAAQPARPRGAGAAADRHHQPGRRAPAAAPAGAGRALPARQGGGAGRPAGRHRAALLGHRHRRHRHPRGAEGDLRHGLRDRRHPPRALGDARQDASPPSPGSRSRSRPTSTSSRSPGPTPVRLAADRYRPDRIAGRRARRPHALRRGDARLPLPGVRAARRVQGRRRRDPHQARGLRRGGREARGDRQPAHPLRRRRGALPRPPRSSRSSPTTRTSPASRCWRCPGSSPRSCSWCGSAWASSARGAGELARAQGRPSPRWPRSPTRWGCPSRSPGRWCAAGWPTRRRPASSWRPTAPSRRRRTWRASPRPPTAWRARSGAASRSRCTATTTATESRRPRSW